MSKEPEDAGAAALVANIEERLKKAGLEGVEIVHGTSHLPAKVDDQYVESIEDRVKHAGLEGVSIVGHPGDQRRGDVRVDAGGRPLDATAGVQYADRLLAPGEDAVTRELPVPEHLRVENVQSDHRTGGVVLPPETPQLPEHVQSDRVVRRRK